MPPTPDATAMCTACAKRPVSGDYADVHLCDKCAADAMWHIEQADAVTGSGEEPAEPA
jgi:hypothetical protein